MWVCLNDAFMSAVLNDRDVSGKTLKVRARKREHLETTFPGREIIETTNSDYRYRVIIPKAVLEMTMAAHINAIDYTNFKNSVKDNDLHDLYADMWNLHWQYQNQQQKKLKGKS